MGSKNNSCVPITPDQLKQYEVFVNKLMMDARWAPKKMQPAAAPSGGLKFSESTPMEESVNWLEIVKRFNTSKLLNCDNVNHLLNSLSQGLGIGFYVAGVYSKSSGLEKLMEDNRLRRLDDGQKAEFTKKLATASAIAQFSFTSFVFWALSQYKGDKLNSLTMDFPGYPEICLSDQIRGLNCLLAYMGKFIEESGQIRNDLDLLKAVQVAAKGAMDEIKLRQDSLEYTNFFTDVNYKLEGEDFTISGFDVRLNGGVISVEFNHVSFDSIVGNRDAKHLSRRMAWRLACYKPDEKCNVMSDLGGILSPRLGQGKPGTGKSLIGAATATEIDKAAKFVGLPFLFLPYPDTIISTYQGGTAERSDEVWKQFHNFPGLVHLLIDDAENNFEDRTRQGVSAGVRENIGVSLRNLEGASAKMKGNGLVDFLTNIPDQIDPAMLSRMKCKYSIDGAITTHDFMDQNELWRKRFTEVDPSFAQLALPSDYTLLTDQKQLGDLAEAYPDYNEPKELLIDQILKKTLRQHSVDSHDFFGALYAGVLERFSGFSSRDVRNIHDAVNARLMDFDFPEDWMKDPETFFHQEYDRQRQMVLSLMREKAKGLSFSQVWLQETIRYLDNMVAIVDLGHRREVKRAAEQMKIQYEAQEMVRKQLESK